MSELLGRHEVFERDALVHLMVERDLVKGLLEFETDHFVVEECLLWQEMQVLLKRLSNQMVLKATKEGKLCGLGFQHGEHTPGDSHDWEVRIVLEVVVAGPAHNPSNTRQVLLVFVALLSITWDVNTVEACKLQL